MQQMVLYCKNLLLAQHVSATTMPIIRSSTGYVSGLRDAALLSSIAHTRHITYISTPDRQPVNQSTKYHRQRPPV
jgi:hypothetical protein